MHGNRHIGIVLKTDRCFDLSLRSLSVSSRLWRGWYYSSLETWDTFGCRTKHSTFENTNTNIGKTKYKHRKDKYNCRQRQIHILANCQTWNNTLVKNKNKWILKVKTNANEYKGREVILFFPRDLVSTETIIDKGKTKKKRYCKYTITSKC